MDFSLSEVQEMLTDSIEKFIANEYDFERRLDAAATTQVLDSDLYVDLSALLGHLHQRALAASRAAAAREDTGVVKVG